MTHAVAVYQKELTATPKPPPAVPTQVWQHSWVRNGPQWHERGVNVYALVADPNSPGGVRGDEQVRSAGVGIGLAGGRRPWVAVLELAVAVLER